MAAFLQPKCEFQKPISPGPSPPFDTLLTFGQKPAQIPLRIAVLCRVTDPSFDTFLTPEANGSTRAEDLKPFSPPQPFIFPPSPSKGKGDVPASKPLRLRPSKCQAGRARQILRRLRPDRPSPAKSHGSATMNRVFTWTRQQRRSWKPRRCCIIAKHSAIT